MSDEVAHASKSCLILPQVQAVRSIRDRYKAWQAQHDCGAGHNRR